MPISAHLAPHMAPAYAQAAGQQQRRCPLHIHKRSVQLPEAAHTHVSRADRLRARAAPANTDLRERLAETSGLVTDQAVPEGHKGLHGFLYGEGGAEAHDSGSQYNFREVCSSQSALFS